MGEWRRTMLAGAAGAAITLLLAPGLSWASHQWSDVKNGNFFHESVGNFTDAGCATGFNDGTFRPNNSVTRGQMARFVNACGGRVGFDQGFATLSSSAATLATVPLEAGALGGEGGFIWAHLDMELSTGSTGGFSCEVRAQLRHGSTIDEELFIDIADTPQIVDDAQASASALIPVGPMTTTNINARAFVTCSGQIGANALLTAMYFPFGPDGSGGEANPAELAPDAEPPRG